jgi:hypothetical protein
MNKLSIGDIKIEYPANWNELKREHLISLAQLLQRDLSPVRFRFFALLILLDAVILAKREKIIDHVRHYFVKRKKNRFLLSSLVFHDLLPTTDFLMQTSKLTKNLFPVIKVNFANLYGPDDCLYNVSFEEFLMADRSFYDYLATGNMEHLDRLVAILYRPMRDDYIPNSSDYDGDIRQPFNDHLIDARLEKVASIKSHFKLGVFLFMQGCKYYIAGKFPKVFNKENEGKDDGLGYLGLIDHMNGGDPTKNEKIRKLNAYEAFTRLQKAAEQNAAFKRNIKTRK